MQRLAVCSLMLCSFLLASLAQAYPSLAGPSGTGTLPTADAYPVNDRVFVQSAIDTYNAGPDTSTLLRYTVGTRRFEVGYGGDMHTIVYPTGAASFVDLLDDDDDRHHSHEDPDEPVVDSLGKAVVMFLFAGTAYLVVDSYASAGTRQVNLKYHLTETADNGGIAVGYRAGRTRWSEGDTAYHDQVYLVSTGTLLKEGACQVRGSAGVNWTQLSEHGYRYTAVRPFIGAEIRLDPRVSLVADYQAAGTHLDRKPLYSVALRAQPSRRWRMELGVTNMAADGVSGQAYSNIFAGATVVFGPKK